MEGILVQQNEKIKLSQPQQFMAQDREIVEEAYAGDVIGVFDPGIFSIGDTLCSKEKFEFKKNSDLCAGDNIRTCNTKGYHEA